MTPGPRTRLVTGAVLGRYRLERLLGTGGMASVWQARDERLGRTVAVKILSETLALDADYVRRFEREAKIAAGLSHPNLVSVFDFGTEDGRPYLVTELIEGGTLADRIESGAPVDAETLARQLLAALAHIHAAGVVHRDVKPANVLLDDDGHSRLTDFGIAQPHGAERFTKTGQVVGTRGYMAPEVEAGEPATPRSDLYSAGVVIDEAAGLNASPEIRELVEWLTGEEPRTRAKSAKAALKLLGGGAREASTEPIATAAPTEVRPPGERDTAVLATAHSRKRAAAVLAIGAVLVGLGIALAQAIGGDEKVAAGEAVKLPASTTQDRGTRKTASAHTPQPAPAPAPAPATTTAPVTTSEDPCAPFDQYASSGSGDVGEAFANLDKDGQKELEKQFKECAKARGVDEHGHGNAFGHYKAGGEDGD